MNRCVYALFVAVTVFAFLTFSFVEVPTGTPPFGSLVGGPFDVVNLGNLNAHFDINVRTKDGRVTPFTYDITYDTSIWYARECDVRGSKRGCLSVDNEVSASGWPEKGRAIVPQAGQAGRIPVHSRSRPCTCGV
jgi:hypothetical protein